MYDYFYVINNLHTLYAIENMKNTYNMVTQISPQLIILKTSFKKFLLMLRMGCFKITLVVKG